MIEHWEFPGGLTGLVGGAGLQVAHMIEHWEFPGGLTGLVGGAVPITVPVVVPVVDPVTVPVPVDPVPVDPVPVDPVAVFPGSCGSTPEGFTGSTCTCCPAKRPTNGTASPS